MLRWVIQWVMGNHHRPRRIILIRLPVLFQLELLHLMTAFLYNENLISLGFPLSIHFPWKKKLDIKQCLAVIFALFDHSVSQWLLGRNLLIRTREQNYTLYIWTVPKS